MKLKRTKFPRRTGFPNTNSRYPRRDKLLRSVATSIVVASIVALGVIVIVKWLLQY